METKEKPLILYFIDLGIVAADVGLTFRLIDPLSFRMAYTLFYLVTIVITLIYNHPGKYYTFGTTASWYVVQTLAFLLLTLVALALMFGYPYVALFASMFVIPSSFYGIWWHDPLS